MCNEWHRKQCVVYVLSKEEPSDNSPVHLFFVSHDLEIQPLGKNYVQYPGAVEGRHGDEIENSEADIYREEIQEKQYGIDLQIVKESTVGFFDII